MRLLGAILAGGRSRRFGSDKALAAIDGRPMLAHVAERLAPQCDAIVVIGRDWPGLARADDVPEPGMGPLGGLAGALAYALRHGYDAVLTSSCDLPALLPDLIERLAAPDALFEQQPTIGLWRAGHAQRLHRYLLDDRGRAMRAWGAEIGARFVADAGMANINTPEDMEAFAAGRTR